MILKNILGNTIEKDIHIKGHRNRDIGLYVNVPKGQYVKIENLIVKEVFVPLIKFGEGLLEIGNFEAYSCGGDAFNFRSSNVHVDNFKAYDWKPTRRFASYHTDMGGQIYAVKKNRTDVDPNGTIENIMIKNFHIESNDRLVQGFMASEACRYKNIRIGTESLYCNLAYEYPIVFNTAEDCIIGNKDKVKFSGRVKIANVKNSKWESKNNKVII